MLLLWRKFLQLLFIRFIIIWIHQCTRYHMSLLYCFFPIIYLFLIHLHIIQLLFKLIHRGPILLVEVINSGQCFLSSCIDILRFWSFVFSHCRLSHKEWFLKLLLFLNILEVYIDVGLTTICWQKVVVFGIALRLLQHALMLILILFELILIGSLIHGFLKIRLHIILKPGSSALWLKYSLRLLFDQQHTTIFIIWLYISFFLGYLLMNLEQLLYREMGFLVYSFSRRWH